MSQSLLDLAWQLTQRHEPFVLATVVYCERPTSAKPGAQALIQCDGQITGWVGGSCAQPVVIREALRALREALDPFLLRLGTSHLGTNHADPQVLHFPMTCSSEGLLDIYMEPHLPAPEALLIGDSPVIIALMKLLPVLNFSVSHLDVDTIPTAAISAHAYVLVASHGQYDEEALSHVLRTNTAYVGLVASPRRAEACRAYLLSSGLSEAQIAHLKAPAGLNIGAITPEEIAASILSEIVQVSRQRTAHAQPAHSALPLPTEASLRSPAQVVADPAAGTAIDPVCKMEVEIASTRHKTAFSEQIYYFCCPACKRLFETNPGAYLPLNV